jgi:hypothetical protein
VRENRSHGSEGGEAQTFPTPIVFERDCVDRRKGVDDRDKPGQGDLGLFPRRYKQPISLSRTAVGLTWPTTDRGSRVASCHRCPAQGCTRPGMDEEGYSGA